MIKKILPIILIILLVSGCIEHLGTYDINLNYNDREIPITTKIGQTINISLTQHSNYEWIVTNYDNKLLSFTSKIPWKFTKDNTTHVISAFIFTTIKTGQTIINIQEKNKQTENVVDEFSVFLIIEE